MHFIEESYTLYTIVLYPVKIIHLQIGFHYNSLSLDLHHRQSKLLVYSRHFVMSHSGTIHATKNTIHAMKNEDCDLGLPGQI